MRPSTDKTNDPNSILAGLKKLALTKDDPIEQERIKKYVEILEKRLAKKLIKTWTGLFKLYQNPNESWEVNLDEPLEQRRRRLEEGVTPQDYEVIQCLEALEYILGSTIGPPKDIPKISDIPSPNQFDNALGSNILEIHEAALRLFENTILASIVTNKIQLTLAPRVRALVEGSVNERQKTAKSLKKSLARAIDILADVRSVSLPHGNKPLFKNTESQLKLLSVIAIDTARKLIEEGQSLPTKSELRERIRQDLPNVVFSDRKWPEVLKEAGLDKLPSKVPFK